MYEALENEVLRERLRRVRAQKAELANEVLIFLKGGVWNGSGRRSRRLRRKTDFDFEKK